MCGDLMGGGRITARCGDWAIGHACRRDLSPGAGWRRPPVVDGVVNDDAGIAAGQGDSQRFLGAGLRLDGLRDEQAVGHVSDGHRGVVREVGALWVFGGVPQTVPAVEREGSATGTFQGFIGEFGQQVVAARQDQPDDTWPYGLGYP
jgi:hypothetical protein